MAQASALSPAKLPSEEQTLRSLHSPVKTNGTHKTSKHHQMHSNIKGISAKAGG